MNASSPSTILSSIIATVKVLATPSPAPQFNTCDTAVKSKPAVAVAFTETTVTLAAEAVEPVRFTVIVRVAVFSFTE